MSKPRTEGPWAVFTDDAGSKPHTNIIGYRPHTNVVFSLPGHHKDDADVRLIAAAPDLLAALQNLVGEWDQGTGMTLGDRVLQAHAAIAKAAGAAA